MGDSKFSGIEDEGSSDDSAFFHFSAPAALADGAAMIPATTAATAAGRPSAFLLHTYRRRCHLRMAEVGAPALARKLVMSPSPPFPIPDSHAPSDPSRSHRGSALASAASAHHPQVTEATTPTLAPSEPITAVFDGRTLSTAGTSHEASAPAPAADPGAPALAQNEPTTDVPDGRAPSADGRSHPGSALASAASLHDGTIAPTASAVATLAASSSPDVTVSTADGVTAAAASATDTGVDVDMYPSSAAAAPPIAEHICSFLIHTRRRSAGMLKTPQRRPHPPPRCWPLPPPLM